MVTFLIIALGFAPLKHEHFDNVAVSDSVALTNRLFAKIDMACVSPCSIAVRGIVKEPMGINALRLLLELSVPGHWSHYRPCAKRGRQPRRFARCVVGNHSPIGAFDSGDCCPAIESATSLCAATEPPGWMASVHVVAEDVSDWPAGPPWGRWTATIVDWSHSSHHLVGDEGLRHRRILSPRSPAEGPRR